MRQVANESISEYVAQFVCAKRFEDIPANVLRLAKKQLLDCMGLALAGAQSVGSAIVRRHIEEMGCANGAATVFGTNLCVPARFAALANGNAMHADDFDDSYHPSRIHPSAAMTRKSYLTSSAILGPSSILASASSPFRPVR